MVSVDLLVTILFRYNLIFEGWQRMQVSRSQRWSIQCHLDQSRVNTGKRCRSYGIVDFAIVNFVAAVMSNCGKWMPSCRIGDLRNLPEPNTSALPAPVGIANGVVMYLNQEPRSNLVDAFETHDFPCYSIG